MLIVFLLTVTSNNGFQGRERGKLIMRITTVKQRGGSIISTLITLVILAYGVFIGIQYVPQLLESHSIDSILDRMRDTQVADPAKTANDANMKVVRMLQINEMDYMTNNFKVENQDGMLLIIFDYKRELNLVFKTLPINHHKTMLLRK